MRAGAPPLALVVLGALVRAVPRAPVAGLTGVALVAVPAVAWLGGHRGAIAALQASAVALAGVAVTLLQQPRGATDAAPVTIARRRALLLGAALGPFALLWIALLALAGVDGGEARALTLQLAAVTSLALGLGARGEDPARALAAVALTFGACRVRVRP